jgi:hypothetical protein
VNSSSPDPDPVPARPLVAHRPALWEWILLLEALVLAAYLRFRWADFDLDDSFITYSYARSLAEGRGLTFAGMKVLGTTTPLYALMLGGLGAIGVPIVLSAKIIGLLSAVAACILMFLLVRAVLGPWFALLASTLLAINAPHALISMSGMETGLYVALVLGAFYSFYRGRGVVTACLAGAVCLLRPDGVLLALVLALAHLFEWRRVQLASLLCFALPLVIWVVYAWREFGSPIPTSVTAKLAYPEYGAFKLEVAIRTLGPAVVPYLLGFGAVGLLYACVRVRMLLPLVGWTGLYLLAFTRAPNFGWYYVPPVPGLIVLMVAGLAGTLAIFRVFRRWKRLAPVGEGLRIAAGLAASAWILALGARDALEYRASMDRTYGRDVTSAYHSLALWVRDNTPQDATIAVPEVGYVGFYSERKVLDLAGLCTAEVIPYLRKRHYAEIIHDFRPEYVALTTEGNRPLHNVICASPWFQAHYRACQSFPYRGGSKYIVYALQDQSRLASTSLAAPRPAPSAAPPPRPASP